MTFREWLFERLMDDGVIDDTWDLSEMEYDRLMETTTLLDEDLDDYKYEYSESCSNSLETPVWDLD